MAQFVAKRLLSLLLTLLVLATGAFFLLRAAPGGPFDADRELPPKVREALERRFGLDRPLLVQYGVWMSRLVTEGDLGPSFQYPGLGVTEVLAASLPPSLALGAAALLIALLTGIPAGVVAGSRPGGRIDRTVVGLSLLFLSVPNFVVGAGLLALFALGLRLFPAGGWLGPESVVLPAVALALPIAAVIARLAREGVAGTMGEDFVRTARAAGVPEGRILFVHALRPSLLPTAAWLGPAAAGVLTGSVVVETLFAIPGLGIHFVQGALNRDYGLVLGTVLVYGALLVLLHFVSDVLLAILDPRIRSRA